MADLIRANDWSQTSLGLPGTWPQSLRTTLGILLNSRLPMLLFWGSRHVCFCNDSCSDNLIGDAHALLGKPGAEAWPDHWDVLKPLVDRVLSGEPAADEPVPGLRKTAPEGVLWTASYSPVIDERGDIAGVLVTCFESVDPARYRQQELDKQEQLEFAVEATELGTWDLNPATGHFTANARLKEWFGLEPTAEVPLQLALETIAGEDRERVAAAIREALQFASGGQYEQEYTLVHPVTSLRRIVRAKGRAWFDTNRVAYRFNGTLQDITQQALFLQRMSENQQQLLSLFEQSPVAIAIIDKEDLVFRMANPFYGQLVGRSLEEIINKPLLEALPELAGQGFDQLLRGVMETGEPFVSRQIPVNIRRNQQLTTIYVDLAYQPYRGVGENITGVMAIATDVTEPVLARAEIEEREAKFRTLIEEAPFATALYVGESLVIDTANEAMIRVWGKTPDVVGMRLAEALPELEGQPFFGLLQNVFQTGVAYHTQEQSADLVVDGKLQRFWFNFTYKPLRNVAGQVYAILNMAVDVSGQVAARKHMEESVWQFRNLVENAISPICILKGEAMVLEMANDLLLDVWRTGPEAFGKPFLQLLPEMAGQPFMEWMLEVYHTGVTRRFNEVPTVFTRETGEQERRYFDYVYQPYREPDGTISGVIAMAVDITEPVLARQKMEEAETRLLGAIELAELGTWTIDVVTGRITYSERLQEWLGVTEGKLDALLSPLVHPKDQARVRQALVQALSRDGNGRFDQIYTIVHQQTGQERIIHSLGQTVFDANGQALYLAGTVQDVTIQQQLQLALAQKVQERTEELAATNEELQATNEELANANQSLRRSNEELAQYAYVASHDLQEPLRKIHVFSGMLGKSEVLTEKDKLVTGKIIESAARMSNLIKDLLEFSHLTYADSVVRLVNLTEVAQSVEKDFELTIAEKAATLHLGPLPTIEATPLRMNQLFYNLLNNALKFSVPDRPPVIRIGAQALRTHEVEPYIRKPLPYAQYYRISVADNGIGFETGYAEQIFEVFKRLHTREVYPGSGIGLALCRRIVNNLGGVLYAESVPGEGSVFHFVLPDRQTEPEA